LGKRTFEQSGRGTAKIYQIQRIDPPSQSDPVAERLKIDQDIYKIFKWAQEGNVKELKRLLDNGEDPNKRDFDRGNTPLHWACAKGTHCFSFSF
jgi:ankyrin repeat protein